MERAELGGVRCSHGMSGRLLRPASKRGYVSMFSCNTRRVVVGSARFDDKVCTAGWCGTHGDTITVSYGALHVTDCGRREDVQWLQMLSA